MSEEKITSEEFGAIGKADMARLLIEISEENDRLREQVAGFSAGMREIDELNRSMETLMSAAAVGLKATKRLDERMNELETKLCDLMSASARLIEEFRQMSSSVKKMNALSRMRFAEEDSKEPEQLKDEFDLDEVLAALDARAASRELIAAHRPEAPAEKPEAPDVVAAADAGGSAPDAAEVSFSSAASASSAGDDKDTQELSRPTVIIPEVEPDAAEPDLVPEPEPEITAENLDEALARRRAEIHALREAERRSNAIRNGSWSKIFSD